MTARLIWGGLLLSPFLLALVAWVLLSSQTERSEAVSLTDPLLLIFPTVLAASCAFMMPVATPPNAVVFASGYIRIGQLIRAGIGANIVGIVFSTLMAYTLVRWVFGIDIGVLPDWAATAQ